MDSRGYSVLISSTRARRTPLRGKDINVGGYDRDAPLSRVHQL
jgi:hypothetical protein